MKGYRPDQLWPRWTRGLGAGGTWKQAPEDFVVTEIPLAEADGEGEHGWYKIGKIGFSTEDVAAALAEAAGVSRVCVGYAGLKDREAKTVQAFTVQGGKDVVSLPDGMRILGRSRTRHKLRVGELAGNHFALRLRGTHLERLKENIKSIERSGMPNYYGVQRVGGDAPGLGRALLLGQGPVLPEPRVKFALSAYQSLLFNKVLVARGSQRLDGDLLEDGIPTGPMFGASMPWPVGDALDLEEAILLEERLPEGVWQRFPRLTRGTRRKLWVDVKISLTPTEDGVWLRFGLPPGSYATVLLEELL